MMTQRSAGRPTFTPTIAYISGRYYGSGTGDCGAVTFTVAANVLYARPIFISRPTTFTGIDLEITTLAAGNCRMGVYQHDYATQLPVTLKADLGTVSTGTTGVKEITISQALGIGWHWLCAVFDATPTTRRTYYPSDILESVILGSSAWFDVNVVATGGVSASFTYGALPSTFPGSPTWRDAASTPIIALKV